MCRTFIAKFREFASVMCCVMVKINRVREKKTSTVESRVINIKYKFSIRICKVVIF